MPKNVTGVNTARIGTCPHGLPQGACPICNGGGGGAKKLGTMSWSECFAEGVRMKNAKMAAEVRAENPFYNASSATTFQGRISAYINNVQQTIAILMKTLPKPLADAVNLLNKVFITPVLNLIDKLPKIIQGIQNAVDTVRSALVNIADKLTSVFGELKNAIVKKASDTFNNFRKKLKKLFSVFGSDEDEEVEAKNFLEVLSSKKEE